MAFRHFVNIGPSIPQVPVSHFTKFDREVIEQAWQLVGPSVARNFSDFKPAPLWMIFAACYAEGLHHGSEIMREKLQKEQEWTPPTEP